MNKINKNKAFKDNLTKRPYIKGIAILQVPKPVHSVGCFKSMLVCLPPTSQPPDLSTLPTPPLLAGFLCRVWEPSVGLESSCQAEAS